jgi:hypothetical protein
MVVALLLCTSAVTPRPAQKASGFFYAATENGTQASAIDAHHAGTHDMRAPHQQSDRGQQV